METCAFLNSGSDASLIKEDLARKSGLEGESVGSNFVQV